MTGDLEDEGELKTVMKLLISKTVAVALGDTDATGFDLFDIEEAVLQGMEDAGFTGYYCDIHR